MSEQTTDIQIVEPVTETFNSFIFNEKKSDYDTPRLFSGQRPGLFNTLVIDEEINRIYKYLKVADWDENEFPADTCKTEFEVNPEHVVSPMRRTLGWQWETDTAATRMVTVIASIFSTHDGLSELYQRIGDNEALHARSYSEIVKFSFEDPNAVMKEVLEVRESMDRLKTVAKVFNDSWMMAMDIGAGRRERDDAFYQQVYLFWAALYFMERIQFVASFAITFTYGMNKMFLPIVNTVQKIMFDEMSLHARAAEYVLNKCLEEDEMAAARLTVLPLVQQMFEEVVDAEVYWLKNFLLPDGTDLFGWTNEDYASLVYMNANHVRTKINLSMPERFVVPEQHPIPLIEPMFKIDDRQLSPQEERGGQYINGSVIRDDAGKVFEFSCAEFDI